MARWVWPTAAGVVTSATGVVINLATDRADNVLAWVGVVALTALGVGVGVAAQRSDHGPRTADRQPPTAVHNSTVGPVHGTVVQAGQVRDLTVDSRRTVNQSATAHDGGTVHQAGRDVHLDGGR